MSTPEDARTPWIHSLAEYRDERGTLIELTTAGTPGQNWRRAFSISVPGPTVRGGHAHRRCTQGLVAITGSVRVKSDTGRTRSEFFLARPQDVLVVPPRNWLDLEFTQAATLLVLADRPYEQEDYVHEYGLLLQDEWQTQLST